MNRTDRLYALVEELRGVAPGRLSARELAGRFEVSVRTVERDISALQQAGVPIYADVGRGGGYAIDKRMSLPPLNFSAAETVAVAVALGRTRGTPFDAAGASALGKILAAMPEAGVRAARELAGRVQMLEPVVVAEPGRCAGVVRQAVAEQRPVAMSYVDRYGAVSERVLEPMVLMLGREGWYVIGWCRLREETRLFRLDRIQSAELMDVKFTPRAIRYPDDLPADVAASRLAL
ncbi:helix-turn-helix transcriptional regulator [Nocardia arthritidis]|uniref:WYL domain-containing protein n=1 Tax=Nocardia arthritidis TaxID=228602 RepID=A0A6G9YCY4_9NOCA|nr:WYL domain-containing protein [Nocardia arthritidis]QIS11081.1 WYL domain-containing protein [Nocardia arthritidis]